MSRIIHNFLLLFPLIALPLVASIVSTVTLAPDEIAPMPEQRNKILEILVNESDLEQTDSKKLKLSFFPPAQLEYTEIVLQGDIKKKIEKTKILQSISIPKDMINSGTWESIEGTELKFQLRFLKEGTYQVTISIPFIP
jgi:hypothetical protein